MTSGVPQVRVHVLRDVPPRVDGQLVLYWMIGARRIAASFAVDRAVEWARELNLPLVILEPLRCDYPYASDRLHRFVIDGMREHASALTGEPVTYVPWVETERGLGRGMFEAWASRASVIVTDLSGIPWIRGMVREAARRSPVRMEAVDGLGIVPMAAVPRAFPTAHAFRRFTHGSIAQHLARGPRADPFADLELPRLRSLPSEITARWPATPTPLLERPDDLIARLPIDHRVGVVPYRGGAAAAREQLARFVRERLERYGERSHPDADAASGLSPWIHFGHLAVHEILGAVLEREGISASALAARQRDEKATGSKEGWWGLSPEVESFLDELVTWRELAHVNMHLRADAASWEGIPEWARRSLESHAGDAREHLYSLERLARAETSDPVWNAAQRQLLSEGRIQNYLRMLWGKRTLAWTAHPREAHAILVELNDRYAVDGRDPASWMNIGWIFGAYDRPWAPERPIYGVVRYMTSQSAQRKLRMKRYMERWGAGPAQLEL